MDDLEPAHLVSGAGFVPSLTHDGLVSYAHTAGAVGATIVADLADRVPERTGTVYVFRLRPGIRYNTGQPVRARDVRYSLERLFRAGERGFASSPESGFTDIVGAAACVRRPETCNLADGVQADDDAGTVRIQLTRSNPLFLNRLAEWFFVVPDGTPITDRSRGPVPGTGPYTVTHFVPGQPVELRRNPYFQQWSRASQPDGYPDSIIIDVGAITAATVDQITKDQLDLVLPGDAADLPPATVRTAALGHRLQLFDGPQLGVGIAILNTRLPPFNDPRVRQALNYAVDRNELARRRMAAGLVTATPTCQVLIPGIGGYRPYCPYTTRPGSGRWTGPDLSKARELVRESGTAGQPVTVWEPATRYDPDGAYFVEVLNALHYRARLHTPRPDFAPYLDGVLTPGGAQLAVLFWTSTPSGDDLTQHLLCRSFDAEHHNFYSNYGGFCDPQIDRDYDRAARSALTDHPTEANQLWSQIDQRLVDAAPWVPAWNISTTGLASPRVGDITPHFQYDVLLDQLWVQ
jgi:peptide/nickel transport system substrate-binding protein